MRLIFVTLLSFACLAAVADAQTPAKPPAPRRAASPTATTTALSITVTDGRGTPLTGVSVRATGSIEREGTTDANGAVRFEGLRSGSYRLRFAHDGFVTLERELAIPAGQRSLDQHVMLSADTRPAPVAPPPPAAPEPPKAPALPPPGKAITVSIPDFIEKNFIGGNQPQKVSDITCSGLTHTVLWQIRDAWDNRQHAGADAMLYVVGGEGTLKMGSEVPLQAGTFISVPRGTTYALSRRGRNPLIVLATLTGEPCM